MALTPVHQADVNDAFMHVGDSAGVLALDPAFLQVAAVRCLRYALDIGSYADIFQTLPPNAGNTHQNLIAHRETVMRVTDPVPSQVAGHNGGLYTEYLDPDDFFGHCNYAALDDAPFINAVAPGCVGVQIKELPLFEHGLFTAGNHAAGLGVRCP